MSAPAPPENDVRVLVVAPTGRDAEVIAEVLRRDGMACQACRDVDELGRELARGAGALLVTTEALATEGAVSLERVLERQEPWSDIPVILAAEHGSAATPAMSFARLERAGAVTVLERPIRVVTLRTVLQAALRARRRQYEMRDTLEALRNSVDHLATEQVVRERFVSLLAHDLRGPLSAATLSAEALLAQPDGPPAARALAQRMQRNLQRMDRMIRDLLDAHRVQAGRRLTVEVQACDLVPIVAEALEDLDAAARARVRTDAPPRLEGVWAPDQLRRAVWNLVVNALKYGAAGGTVRVTLAREADGAVVSVHNDGAPIPPDEQRLIFEPFGRARGAEGQRGWGLGLSLVRACVEAHGGRLQLTSAAGEGTTFTMRLPIDARPFQQA